MFRKILCLLSLPIFLIGCIFRLIALFLVEDLWGEAGLIRETKEWIKEYWR